MNENSDVLIVRALSPEISEQMSRNMKEKFPVWTDLMNECFRRLHLECKVSKSDLVRSLEFFPAFSENLKLVRLIHDRKIPQFIVSDANEFLIYTILEASTQFRLNLEQKFQLTRIFLSLASGAAGLFPERQNLHESIKISGRWTLGS